MANFIECLFLGRYTEWQLLNHDPRYELFVLSMRVVKVECNSVNSD